MSMKNRPKAIGPLRIVSLAKTFQDVDRGFPARIPATSWSDVAFPMMTLQCGAGQCNLQQNE